MLLKERYEYNPDTDLLGKGGLAEVFKAYDRERKCYVALKKFHPSADIIKYGIREEFQKSINFAHGNIVRAYDFFTVVRKFEDGETHETQYGVMELIEGGDLAGYLNKKPDNSELLEVVKGILRGLDYLHKPDSATNKRSIVHRDIKPGNILIFYNNEGKPIPKIADFNVAKEMSGNLESSISMVGTYEYMAPEQLNVTKYGMDNHVHANADLWALGVILCDYFMGKSLFGKRSEGNTQGQIIGKILDEPIPSEVIQRFPAPFNGIISRCLVRNAKDRVQSAGELLTYLKNIDSLPTTVVGQRKQTETNKRTPPSKEPDTGPLPILKRKNGSNVLILLSIAAALFVFFLVYKLVVSENDQPKQKSNPESSDSSFNTGSVIFSENDPFADDMVYVEGGTFMMGCTSEQGNECEDDEKPAHEVTLNGFYISKYEVTQAKWRAVMGNDPPELYFKGCNQCPVEGVSWDYIQEFLEKLNTKTGNKYRLPTEAEWEYAARGGNRSRSYLYSGSNALIEVGWYYENSGRTTHPVGEKTPNELGLYDMSGNVWEWCSDWYDSEYYRNSPSNNPKGPSTGALRVLRGGGWFCDAQDCRLAYRPYYLPGFRFDSYGFRLVVVP